MDDQWVTHTISFFFFFFFESERDAFEDAYLGIAQSRSPFHILILFFAVDDTIAAFSFIHWLLWVI